MAVELKPLGNACNLNCTYCYQDPMRRAGNTMASKTYDLDLMLKIARESGIKNDYYVLFGGEPLLLPKKDLEIIFKESYELNGGTSIQTNGSLIEDEHIELFKKYNVHVGVSIDGPNDLNDLRVSKQKNKSTRELTEATINNLLKLVRNNISCGVIITVHKLNGTKEKLPRLLNFISWLGNIGIRGGNIHMLEVDSKEASEYFLTTEENTWAFLELAKFFDRPENKDLEFHPFVEMELLMRSDDSKSHCIWNSCDPMNTGAVYGIEGNGQLSNCGMVNKEGIEWTKADDRSFIRDLVLYQTPQDKGGCKDCPFFVLCNGYCTGAAIDNDWRNRTYHCNTVKAVFQYYEEKIEKEGGVPFSKRPDRAYIEELYIESIMNSDTRLTLSEAIKKAQKPKKIPVK